MDHQGDWWEENILVERLPLVRGRYEAQFPMATFARSPMGEKGAWGQNMSAQQRERPLGLKIGLTNPQNPSKSEIFFAKKSS